MKKLFVLSLFLPLWVLTACFPEAPPMVGLPGADSAPISIESHGHQLSADAPLPLPVLFKTESHAPAIYEPTDGIYLGAWLPPHASKHHFVHSTGAHHGVFAYEMPLGEAVPSTWLLKSMAALATPLLVIHPGETAGLHTGDEITNLAQKLGAFNLPMFVALTHGNMPAREFTVMFRYARALFLQYAPHIAFVWVAPGVDATGSSPFFPGHDAVDWVGVPLLASRDAHGFTRDIIAAFTPFYHHFSRHHPIMVLPLGVSHFSRSDHTYHVQAAANELSRVYGALGSFPRLGLVVYGDAFGLSPTSGDSFAISAEFPLLAAYGEAVTSTLFLSALSANAPQAPYTWVRSAFPGYVWEGRLFVDRETLTAEMPMPTSLPRSAVTLSGRAFVPAEDIPGAAVVFCDIRKAILVKN